MPARRPDAAIKIQKILGVLYMGTLQIVIQMGTLQIDDDDDADDGDDGDDDDDDGDDDDDMILI
jgi:hypothetical protein